MTAAFAVSAVIPASLTQAEASPPTTSPQSGKSKLFQWSSRGQTLSPLAGNQVRAASARASSTGSDDPNVLLAADGDGLVTSRKVIYVGSGPDSPQGSAPSGARVQQWSVDQEFFEISWDNPQEDVAWTASIDGAPMEVIYGNHWRAKFPSAGIHTFTLEASIGSGDAVQPYVISVSTRPASAPPTGSHLGDTMLRSAAANRDLVFAAGSEDIEVGLSYRAFIPDRYVPTPLLPCKALKPSYKFYGGDGRGFAKNPQQFNNQSRSSVDVMFHFTGGKGQQYPVGYYTGDTTAYDKDHKLIARKNAGRTSTALNNPINPELSDAQGELRINGTNPLCKGALHR